MGDDLVIVNEKDSKVVILNSSARQILDGILRSETDNQIAISLHRAHTVERAKDLRIAIEKTRGELIEAGVLVPKTPFETPVINVRDLKTALQGIDLTQSTVSQYE
jgi:hypothetical protein